MIFSNVLKGLPTFSKFSQIFPWGLRPPGPGEQEMEKKTQKPFPGQSKAISMKQGQGRDRQHARRFVQTEPRWRREPLDNLFVRLQGREQ